MGNRFTLCWLPSVEVGVTGAATAVMGAAMRELAAVLRRDLSCPPVLGLNLTILVIEFPQEIELCS